MTDITVASRQAHSDEKSIAAEDKIVTTAVEPNELDFGDGKEVGVQAGELTLEEDTRGGLGRHLGLFSTTFLIVGRIIGSGIFSTPASITKSTGSVGAAFMVWLLGFAMSMSGLLVWLEFGCMIPRSGGEKVYLEASYHRPRHFVTIIFAVQSILLGFSATGCITFASNMALAGGTELTEHQERAIAGCAMIFVVFMHSLAPKIGVKVMNVVGVIKVIILLFIVVTGWAVLGGGTRIDDPGRSFRNAFEGSVKHPNPYATALFKVLGSFAGTLKIAGPLAVTICGILYILANVSYYAASTPDQLVDDDITVASFFMERVFGETAMRVLSVFVAISALGNVMTVTFAHSRICQEIAKEGVLPFGSFWASTWPKGAPSGGMFLHFVPSIIMITAIPFGDAYNFIVDLEGYARAIVFFATVLGLFLLRWKRPWAERPFKVWIPVAVFFMVAQAFMLVVPFLRPPGGEGDTSLPYYAYPLVSIGVLAFAMVYYAGFVWVLPFITRTELTREKVALKDGTMVMKFVRTRSR